MTVGDQRRYTVSLELHHEFGISLDHIIHSTLDPDVTILISSSTVTEEEVSRVRLHVCLEVSLVISEDCSCQRRPVRFGHEYTLDIVSLQNLTTLRVNNGKVHTEEGECSGTRFGGDGSWKGCDNVRTRLSHPVGIDDGTLVLSGKVVEPMPCLRVDGFSDGSKDSEGRQIVVFDVLFAHSSKQSDGSGSGVKLSRLPFVDKVPVSRRGRVDGCGFENGGGDSIQERTVDDIRVTRDPSDISHTGEFVVWVDIEDVFDSELSTQKISTGRVDYSLGFPGGSRGLSKSDLCRD